MNFTGGLILIAIALGMVMIARPKGDETAPFLRGRHWIVGQAYIMLTLILFVIGVTVTIMNRP